MEYLINVLLEFIPLFIWVTLVYVVSRLIKRVDNKLATKVYIIVTCIILVLSLLGTDNTYKHTTGYNKHMDVKTLEVRQKSSPVVIKDATKPIESEQERKKAFDEMVKYKKENKQQN